MPNSSNKFPYFTFEDEPTPRKRMRKQFKAKLEIINRSSWPDGFINIIAPWIIKRAGITSTYHITLRRATYKRTWRGRCASHWQTLCCHRRVYRPNELVENKDSRFVWSAEQKWSGPIETLVFLMAHEAWHATGGHPRHFRNKGRTDAASMEYRCNKFGIEAVEAFRAEWPTLKLKVRREIQRLKCRKIKAKASKAAKRGPNHKLALAQSNLDNWNRKLRFAENKVKAYQRKVKLFQCRQRAAATASAKLS